MGGGSTKKAPPPAGSSGTTTPRSATPNLDSQVGNPLPAAKSSGLSNLKATPSAGGNSVEKAKKEAPPPIQVSSSAAADPDLTSPPPTSMLPNATAEGDLEEAFEAPPLSMIGGRGKKGTKESRRVAGGDGGGPASPFTKALQLPPKYASSMEGVGSASPTLDPARVGKGLPPEHSAGIKVAGDLLGVHPFEDRNYADDLLSGAVTEQSIPFSTPFADDQYPSCCTVGDEEDELLADWYQAHLARQTDIINRLSQQQDSARASSLHGPSPAVTGVAALAALSEVSAEAFVYFSAMMALVMHIQKSPPPGARGGKGVGFEADRGEEGNEKRLAGGERRRTAIPASAGFNDLNPFTDLGLDTAQSLSLDHLREVLMRCSVSLAAGGGSSSNAMSYAAVEEAAAGGVMPASGLNGEASNVPYLDDLKCLKDWMGRKRRHGTPRSFYVDRFGEHLALERKIPPKLLITTPPVRDHDTECMVQLARRLGRATGILPEPVREHSHLRFGLEGFHLDRLVSDTSVLTKKKFIELKAAEEAATNKTEPTTSAYPKGDDGRSSKRTRGNSGVSILERATMKSDKDSKITSNTNTTILRDTEKQLLQSIPRYFLTEPSLCMASRKYMYHDKHHIALNGISLPPPPPPTYYKAVYYAQYFTLPDPTIVAAAIKKRQIKLNGGVSSPPSGSFPDLSAVDLHNVYVSLVPHYLRRPDTTKSLNVEGILLKLRTRLQEVKDLRRQHMNAILNAEKTMRTRTLQEWRDKRKAADLAKKREAGFVETSSRQRSKTRLEEELRMKKDKEDAAQAGESLAQMLKTRSVQNSKKFRRTPIFDDLPDLITTGFLSSENNSAAVQPNSSVASSHKKSGTSTKKGNGTKAGGGPPSVAASELLDSHTPSGIENTIEGLYRALILELQEEKRKRILRKGIINAIMEKKSRCIWAQWKDEEEERANHKGGSRYGAAGAYFNPYTQQGQGTTFSGVDRDRDTSATSKGERGGGRGVSSAKLAGRCVPQEEQRVLALLEHRLHAAKCGVANYVTRELLAFRGSTQILAGQTQGKLSSMEQFELKGDGEEGAKSHLLLTRRFSDVFQNLDDLVDRNITVPMSAIWIDEVGGDLLVEPDEVCEEALRLLFIHAFGVFEPTKVADVAKWIPKVIKEKASSVWGVAGGPRQGRFGGLEDGKGKVVAAKLDMMTRNLSSLGASSQSNGALVASPLVNSGELIGVSQNPVATMLDLMSLHHHDRQDAWVAVIGNLLGKWSLKESRRLARSFDTSGFMEEIGSSIKYALHNEQNRKEARRAKRTAQRKSKVANHAIWEAMQDMTSSSDSEMDEDGTAGDLIVAMLPDIEDLTDSLTRSTSDDSDPLVELGEDTDEAEEKDRDLVLSRFQAHIDERRAMLDAVDDEMADAALRKEYAEFQVDGGGKYLQEDERRERTRMRRRLLKKRHELHFRNSSLAFVRQITSFDAMMSDNSVAVTHAIIDISKAYGRLPMANELQLLFKKDLRTRLAMFYAQTNASILEESHMGSVAQAYHVQDNDAYIKAHRRAAEQETTLNFDPMAALLNKGPESANPDMVMKARRLAELLDDSSSHGAQASRVQLMEGSKLDRMLVVYAGKESLLEQTAFEKYCTQYLPKPVVVRTRNNWFAMENIFSCQRRLFLLQDSRARGSSANFLNDLGAPTASPLRQLGQLPYEGCPEDESRAVRPEEATIDDLLRPFLLPALPGLPQQPQKLFANWKTVTNEASRVELQQRRLDLRQRKKYLLERKRRNILSKSEKAELEGMLITQRRTVRGAPESDADEGPREKEGRRGGAALSSSSSDEQQRGSLVPKVPPGAVPKPDRKVSEWLESGSTTAASGKKNASGGGAQESGGDTMDTNLIALEKYMLPQVVDQMRSAREAAAAVRQKQTPEVDVPTKRRKERRDAARRDGKVKVNSSESSSSDYFYDSSTVESLLDGSDGRNSSSDSLVVPGAPLPVKGSRKRVIGGVFQRKRYYGDDVQSLRRLDEEERQAQKRRTIHQRQLNAPPSQEQSPDSIEIDEGKWDSQRRREGSAFQLEGADEELSLHLDNEDLSNIFSSISRHFDPTTMHPSMRTLHLERRRKQRGAQLKDEIAQRAQHYQQQRQAASRGLSPNSLDLSPSRPGTHGEGAALGRRYGNEVVIDPADLDLL